MLRVLLLSWFLVFNVSKFQGFKKTLMCLEDIGSMLPNLYFMFLVDIDLQSKIFKILLNGSAGFLGGRHLENSRSLGFDFL